MKLARGNQGATTQDILAIDATGKVGFPAGMLEELKNFVAKNGTGW